MDNPWVMLFGSLTLLTIGAEVLVRGASSLALQLRLSPLFVGMTVVAFGTSAPELAASLAAAARGSDDIAVGNVVGSNIFNIAVILGISALIRPIPVSLAVLRRDLLIVAAVALVPWMAVATGGAIPRAVGAVLLLGLVIYVYTALRLDRSIEAANAAGGDASSAVVPAGDGKVYGMMVDLALILIGLVALVFGAQTFVANAIDVARAAGISELVIGLTIVAAGTSLPELLTSVVAAMRGHSEIAVGNVLGSNIFNILGVLGICAVVEPQVVPAQVLSFDTPVMVLLSLSLLPLMRSGGRISRREGTILLLAYVAYVAVLMTRGGSA